MANIATIRGWHSGGYYVYWNVSNIVDPISEYPSGGGYPAVSGLTDFCATRLENPDDSNKELLLIWNGAVADGYTVYSTSLGGPSYTYIGKLAKSNSYATSRVVGVATTTNRARLLGTYSVWCETAAEPGDSLFLSRTNNGMVTNVAPIVSGGALEVIGIASARKTSVVPGRVLMTIKISEPILLEETIVV
jgi:hypothetical protein